MKLTTKELTMCSFFLAFLIIATYLKVIIPTIPITMQPFASVIIGLILGYKKGSLTVVIYILLGLIGFPVFSSGSGIGYVLNPTFGFILGFLFCTFISGYTLSIFENKTLKVYIISSILGVIFIYLIGIPYFYFIKNLYLGDSVLFSNILITIFLPLFPKDLISAIFAGIFSFKFLKYTNIK